MHCRKTSGSVTDRIHDGGPKIITKTSYHLVTSEPSSRRCVMRDSHVCGDAGGNKPAGCIKVYSIYNHVPSVILVMVVSNCY